MFEKLNPFKRQPQNPLNQMSVEELRSARIKLEKSRDRVVGEIHKLEQSKQDYFQEGVLQPDKRSKRMAAQRIKEAEEQIRQLDQQLLVFDKQLQIISRFEFIKRNQHQMVESGIDQLLGNMDAGELRAYIDDISVSGAVNIDRLSELSEMLGEALSAGFPEEEDPEIAELIAQMEMAALDQGDTVLKEELPASESSRREPSEPA
jgi:hypothetical protein